MGTHRPFVLVQLSDPHIGATWTSVDPLTRLRAAVEAVRPWLGLPDAVVVTGDSPSTDPLKSMRWSARNSRVRRPVGVVPGNHDDRSALRRAFDFPGKDADPICYCVDVGPLRLVMRDSTIPGEDGGELGSEQLSWLEATLADGPERPTLLVMHHPPLLTGMTPWTGSGSRRALARLGGNRDTEPTSTRDPRRTYSSSDRWIRRRSRRSHRAEHLRASAADLAADKLVFAEEEPPALAVHTLLEGELVSHVFTP